MRVKIGLLGGTFDPPHNGHLLIAQEVLSALALDEVWFIPSQTPPHKEGRKITSGHHRVEMVKLAIEDNPSFRLNTMEFEREGPNYTIDTMKSLRETYPSFQFHFIIGADMVEYLSKWHDIDSLVNLVQFVGVKRPGYKLASDYDIVEVEVPPFGVSSTLLRDRFAKGKNTKYLLPEKVRTYIGEKNVYG